MISMCTSTTEDAFNTRAGVGRADKNSLIKLRQRGQAVLQQVGPETPS